MKQVDRRFLAARFFWIWQSHAFTTTRMEALADAVVSGGPAQLRLDVYHSLGYTVHSRMLVWARRVLIAEFYLVDRGLRHFI